MFTPIRRFINKLTLSEIMREHVNRKCHATTSTRKVEGSITLLACGGKPPYIYSKDEFETEQSSPVFENLYYKQADAHLSETLEGYYEVTQRFWVKDANNSVATYDATFTTPDYTKFRDQSGLNYHVYCAAGETEVTITPGVTYPIPQYYPNVGGPIVNRSAAVVGQDTTHWVQFTDEPFQLALVDNSITRYQLRYIITQFEECARQPAGTCYINIYVHPYMTLSEDLNEHQDISCSACTKATTKGSVTLTIDGGTAPFVYSKDNFATEQSSPVFDNLCLADADCYDSTDNNYVEGIQRFWVKDANNVIVYYDAILKKPKTLQFTTESFDIDLYCAAGENSVLVTPGTTYAIPQYVADFGDNRISRSIQALNPVSSYMGEFNDEPYYLELNNGQTRRYQIRYVMIENGTRCTGRPVSASFYGYINVHPYQET